MLLKISQFEAAKIIDLYLKNHEIKTLGDTEVNNDEVNYTTFDVEVDFSLLQGKES